MSQKDSPTNSDSAPDVQQRYRLDLDGQDLKTAIVKCGPCKTSTPHEWMMIIVGAMDGDPDPMARADLHKRLTLCQNCGNLRLVK